MGRPRPDDEPRGPAVSPDGVNWTARVEFVRRVERRFPQFVDDFKRRVLPFLQKYDSASARNELERLIPHKWIASDQLEWFWQLAAQLWTEMIYFRNSPAGWSRTLALEDAASQRDDRLFRLYVTLYVSPRFAEARRKQFDPNITLELPLGVNSPEFQQAFTIWMDALAPRFPLELEAAYIPTIEDRQSARKRLRILLLTQLDAYLDRVEALADAYGLTRLPRKRSGHEASRWRELDMLIDRCFGGLSYKALAKKHRVSAKTVESRVRAATNLLAEPSTAVITRSDDLPLPITAPTTRSFPRTPGKTPQ